MGGMSQIGSMLGHGATSGEFSMEKKIVSWNEFEIQISSLITQLEGKKIEFDSVHGVPRGGVAIAVALSHYFKVPIVNDVRKGTLIVDDIADSGKTLARFPDNKKAVLFFKDHCKTPVDIFVDKATAWIEFPWEAGEMPAEDAVVRMIEAIGDDPTREGLLQTPKRVVKSWKELFSGYSKNAADILSVTFEDGVKDCDELVICSDIEFYSTCEHHMLPIIGKMHIGYIPDKKVVGLSKLARLGDMFARRLQIQEKMTKQIADALMEHLKPKGVAVVITAKHFCMCARGVNKQNSWMTTSSMQGVLREKPEARAEFLRLCEQSS